MSRETTSKTFTVAAVLSVVCAVIVSASAVALRPIQAYNQALDKKRNILAAADLLSEDKPVEDIFAERIRSRLVEFETGNYSDAFDPDEFDQRRARKNPKLSVNIPAELDVAGFKRRAKYATVYEVVENDQLKTVILPVYGLGLWSTMYGFIAVDPATDKVIGLGFYEHGETPGLGGEIDNVNWKQQWAGKNIYDEKGNVKLTVIKGRVDENNAAASYQIDGLAGATLTTNGIRSMVQYWLGPHGFGPYLENIRKQGNLNG
ncbi:MAG: Na(+)-translocating NADH-quinone reductase subunit C [Oligoflexus sp.]